MIRIFLGGTIALVLLVGAHLSAASHRKVNLCHGVAAGFGQVIEVNESAAPAHYAHGDFEAWLPKGAACSALGVPGVR